MTADVIVIIEYTSSFLYRSPSPIAIIDCENLAGQANTRYDCIRTAILTTQIVLKSEFRAQRFCLFCNSSGHQCFACGLFPGFIYIFYNDFITMVILLAPTQQLLSASLFVYTLNKSIMLNCNH